MRRCVLVLAMVLAIPIAGCGGDEATSSGGGPSGDGDLPTVRLQGLNSGISPIVLKAIETEKLDVKHGFKGEFLYLDPDAAAQTFLQGESDVSFDLDAFGSAIAQNGGHDVTGIYPILSNNASIIVRDDSPYQSPKDLVGKKVGHFGDDSGTTSVMAALLGRDYGINVLKDYQLVEAGPPALVELLKRGEVDAIFDFTPHTERAMTEAGGRVLYLAAEQDQDGAVPGLAYVTSTSQWFKDNPELAKAVQAAAQDAIKLFVDNDYELLREEPYKGLIDQSDETLDAVIKRANEVPLMFEGKWDQAYAKQINAFVDSMGERNILLEEPPPGPVVVPLDELLAR
jgi:NitT/TauT family transport system substrate-binding protein